MAVRVAKIVDVVSVGTPFSPHPIASVTVLFLVDTAPLTPVASATGQTVVETIRVSVVKYVVFDLGGQLVTEMGMR